MQKAKGNEGSGLIIDSMISLFIKKKRCNVYVTIDYLHERYKKIIDHGTGKIQKKRSREEG